MGVSLTGYIDVPKGRRQVVRAALPEHIRLTRAEPGCLRFEVVEDARIAGRFHVTEAFTDPAAFVAHQARAQISHWGEVTRGIERQYTIAGMDDEDCT